MPSTATPPAEVEITETLVRELIREQHADLSDLPLSHVDSGWDNEIYRLGNELAVRIPRREMAVELLLKEQQWLPKLAPQLSIPAPVPVRFGTPSQLFPWPWNIVNWVEGTTADQSPINEQEAVRLARFLKQLHQPTDETAPQNPFRQTSLTKRDESVSARMARLIPTGFITERVKHIWQTAVQTPQPKEQRLIHGDLHARNVLVTEGIISGIIDWGDFTAGDVAIDLCCCWGLFESSDVRKSFLEEYDADANTVRRVQGWAVFYGVTLLETGLADNPAHTKMGEDILLRLDQSMPSLHY